MNYFSYEIFEEKLKTSLPTPSGREICVAFSGKMEICLNGGESYYISKRYSKEKKEIKVGLKKKSKLVGKKTKSSKKCALPSSCSSTFYLSSPVPATSLSLR